MTSCFPFPPLEIQDHRGKSFLLGFLEMDSLLGDSRIYITSTAYGEINLFVPFLNLTETRSVAPGISTKIQLSNTVRMAGFGKENKGILITSNVTISVYVTNARKTSRDVHVVFPTSTLGTEHIAATFTPGDKALIGVIAWTNNTLVQIRFKLEPLQNVTYTGKTYWNGEVLRVFLNKLETFQVQHRDDLTGTVVISSQPVTVISGNTCASVPSSDKSCSHLAQQIPSLSKWGKSFITTPVAGRDKGDIFRMVAAYDTTLISIEGKRNFTLNAGEVHQFELGSKEHRKIVCSKPSMLVQFNKGSLDQIHSEAFALVVPPIEQYTFDYYLVIPVAVEKNSPSYSMYITVLVNMDNTQDILYNASLFRDNFTWVSIPGTNYSAGEIRLKSYTSDSTTVAITHRSGDARFAVVAVGHTDIDGYGYVGGMAMTDINCNRLFPETRKRGDGIDNDCDGRTDEETENGVDDDGDGAIDEDLDFLIHDCELTSACHKDSNRSSVYLDGSQFNCSVTLGDCEGVVKKEWYTTSPSGSAVQLAVQQIRWIKPKINVTFPVDSSVSSLNISVLKNLVPKVSSPCSVSDINVTFVDCRTSIMENTTLITRVWTVREKCGHTVTGNQTILGKYVICAFKNFT